MSRGATRVEQVELSAPLPTLTRRDPGTATEFDSALCIACLHGHPLGVVEVDIPTEGLDPAQLAESIDASLREAVSRHLSDDGLEPARVSAAGIGATEDEPCNRELVEVLREAPRASVVIVTSGRPERVSRTIRSIAAGSYPRDRYEIVVVDTPRGGAAPLGPRDLPGTVPLRVVVEPRAGISRARNTGLLEAQGELVVFADDDVDVGPDWLARLIAGFGLEEGVDAVSGPTFPSTMETEEEHWFQSFGGLVRGYETRVYALDDPPPDEPLFPFLPGALGSGRGMAFRRDTLRRLGGFDPALGPPTPTLAGEDIEALLRVLLAGGRVVHEPAALVRHAHPRDYATLKRRAWGYGLGLSACLTKSVTRNPRLLPQLVRKIGAGVRYALSPGSEKNAERGGEYPRSLVWRERAGLACGPFAYARSRVQHRGESRALLAELDP